MPYISIANVACGFHAGDPMVMRETVALAKAYGVEVGAHPSYPDLQGFGRRAMDMDAEELTAAVLYQWGALKGFLDAEGMALTYIKPHGALYGLAARDEAMAHAIADAAEVFGVPVLGMAGTQHEEVYTARGLTFLAEYYADLEYDDDGCLIITRKHMAYDPGETAGRVARVLREGVAETASGGRSRCGRTPCASTPTRPARPSWPRRSRRCSMARHEVVTRSPATSIGARARTRTSSSPRATRSRRARRSAWWRS